MKTSLAIIGVVVLFAVGWLLISKTGQHQNMYSDNTDTQTQTSVQYDKAPDFRLQDYSGKTVSLADFAGKPLVINSWAAWCPFCVKELPDFAALQKEFVGKISVIAVDRVESLEVAKKFSDQVGVTGQIVLLLDPSDSFYQAIGGFSMPETIFVDADGFIVYHKRGPMELDEMRTRINNIFNL